MREWTRRHRKAGDFEGWSIISGLAGIATAAASFGFTGPVGWFLVYVSGGFAVGMGAFMLLEGDDEV